LCDDSCDAGTDAADIEDVGPSNQMMTLASQIIAAMPERIKLSPSQSKQLLADEIQARRNRAASYGSSFSSYSSACSSNVTPPSTTTASHGFNAEDSGVSTPLDGPSFLEYRSVVQLSAVVVVVVRVGKIMIFRKIKNRIFFIYVRFFI